LNGKDKILNFKEMIVSLFA